MPCPSSAVPAHNTYARCVDEGAGQDGGNQDMCTWLEPIRDAGDPHHVKRGPTSVAASTVSIPQRTTTTPPHANVRPPEPPSAAGLPDTSEQQGQAGEARGRRLAAPSPCRTENRDRQGVPGGSQRFCLLKSVECLACLQIVDELWMAYKQPTRLAKQTLNH